MILLGCGSVHEFRRAAALFNHGLRLRGELVGHHVDLGGELTLGQNGDQVVLLGQAVAHEHITVDAIEALLVGKQLQRAHTDGVIFNTVDVLETSLGQYSVDRHLAALETDLAAVAGAGLRALVAACGCAALTGALASANSALSVCRSVCRF